MSRVADILKDYTELEQVKSTMQGADCLCPYHNDTKPSFKIHEEKGYAKCFSCGTFVPLFDFLVEHGVPFDIAIDYLFTFEREERELEELQEYVLGRKLPKSMIDRGIKKETLIHFGAGYDDYKKLITIPLYYNGKLYGVKYRRYPKQFWYSDGFVKEKFIYNYAPTEERTIVEGESDLWNVYQHSERDISALLGCDVTEEQARLMREHKIIYLALDNDNAGYRGAFKINDALKDHCEIRMIPYPAADPGECGKEDWIKAKENWKSFLEFELIFEKKNPELYKEIQEKLKKEKQIKWSKAVKIDWNKV